MEIMYNALCAYVSSYYTYVCAILPIQITPLAIVQRMVDQRCRELTVMPLANVSEACGALSSAFGSSDTDGMY